LVRSRKSIAQPKRPPFILRATIGSILRALRREAGAWNAPILTLMAAERGDPFLTLIGCILSLRTKDATTAAASTRLFARAHTAAAIAALSAKAIERLNRFMATGGTIFFDTRDQGEGGGASAFVGGASQHLRQLVAGLSIPSLEPVPPDHVLTKSFYLMQEFPGRWSGGA